MMRNDTIRNNCMRMTRPEKTNLEKARPENTRPENTNPEKPRPDKTNPEKIKLNKTNTRESEPQPQRTGNFPVFLCAPLPILLTAALVSSLLPVTALAGIQYSGAWEKQVEITAHRGDKSQAPENTMPAFKAAIENGADWIELDVTQTKDGVLVIFHDADLTRIAGRPDKVWDLTYEELSQINAAGHWGPFYKDVRIPSLEEVMDYCKDKIKLNIEVKVNEHQTQDFIPRLIYMIQTKGMTGQCMVTSFDYGTLQTVKQLDPAVETGFISSQAIAQPELFTSADNFVLSIELINSETVDKIHALGKEVIAWTVNDAYSVDKCKRADADNLITDKPEDIIEE